MASSSRDFVIQLEGTMKAKLLDDAPISATSCIFKVPQLLRKNNPDAYQPHILTIGPLHGRPEQQLQPIQDLKQWYLRNLISQMNDFQTLIEEIFMVEKRARECYAESIDYLNMNDFVEMLILDGCFLIQLFRKLFYRNKPNPGDPVFNMDCMIEYLYHDLLLLENQLPWFVLDSLYRLTLNEPSDLSLRILILTVLSTEPSLKPSCMSYLEYIGDKSEDENEPVVHILDLIRTSIVFSLRDRTDSHTDIGRRFTCFGIFKKQKGRYGWKIPPATTLSEAGVKFERSPANSQSIMNINFKDGVFTIPQLLITEMTEPLLRNLIAFEQCYHARSHHITSYAVLLGRLIGSSKDMRLLRKKRIIDNWLSAGDGSKVFNNLYNDTWIKGFHYRELCSEVNMYCEVKWKLWLGKLRRDYCGNPWMIISLTAATVLLCVTVLQTVYTVMQYNSTPPTPTPTPR